jgi:hypothetical protein
MDMMTGICPDATPQIFVGVAASQPMLLEILETHELEIANITFKQ